MARNCARIALSGRGATGSKGKGRGDTDMNLLLILVLILLIGGAAILWLIVKSILAAGLLGIVAITVLIWFLVGRARA
jgi:hypothetical protein